MLWYRLSSITKSKGHVQLARATGLYFVLVGTAIASLNCSLTATRTNTIAPPPNPLAVTTLISQMTNSLPGGNYTRVRFNVLQGSGTNSTSIGLQLYVLPALLSAANIVVNGAPLSALTPSQPPVFLAFTEQQPIVSFSGGANLLSFGGGGLETYRTVEGNCNFSDTLEIFSDAANTIEYRIGVDASGFAAESFGDPNVTRAIVEVSASTGDGFAIESLSIIPEMGSVSESRAQTVPLNPGANVVPINVTFEILVIADAKGTGIFDSIVGASTAGVLLPDGFGNAGSGSLPRGVTIGPFTAQGGGPLPAGLSISSMTSGIIYASPGGQGPTDDDMDGVSSAVDNCIFVANPEQRDVDGDGYGSACDPDVNGDCVVNAADLQQLKLNFFSSEPSLDFNGDGSVNFVDVETMQSFYFGAPGPSAITDSCG